MLTHLAKAMLPVAALFVLGLQPSAQNCGNTSVGFTPLDDLGSGTYQGFQGGLYPGGAEERPLDHEIGGLQQVPHIVPRNAQGQPDPNGRVVLMSLGMSNTAGHFNALRQLTQGDILRHPSVTLFQGAQGGVPAEDMDDPNDPYWTSVLPQKMAQAGISAPEVQVVWFLQANRQPQAPFPQHALTLKEQMANIMRILKANFPNVRIVYASSRIYAGYASTQLNPEPWAYESGFSVKWLIEDQINGDPDLNYDPSKGPVRAPWLAWSGYLWADGLVPRSDGMIWECDDFQQDGTHPSQQGAQKAAGLVWAYLLSDTTASTWYRKEPEPVLYGEAKVTSIGTLPEIGWSGSPSAASNDFEVTLTNAVPNKVALGLTSASPARLSFMGGSLWLAPPFTRLIPVVLDGSGAGSSPIEITPGMIGRTLSYMYWFRDLQHPDGTASGLSDALQTRFRN